MNGAMVFTASQPFTSALVMSNIDMFRYDWYWEKDKGANFMFGNKMPLKNTVGRLRRKAGNFIARKREENREVAKIRRVERQKQRIETTKYAEKIAGERRRKYVAAGGFGGELRRGFGGVGRAFGGPVIAGPRLVRKARKKRKKKIKRRKK